MKIEVHHHYHADKTIGGILHEILGIVRRLEKKESVMSVQLDELIAAVAENTAIDAAAIQLIEGLAQQIADSASDPEKVLALVDEIKAQSAAMSAAIAANTVVTPPTE